MTRQTDADDAQSMHSTQQDAHQARCDGGLPACDRCQNADPNRVAEFPEPTGFPDDEDPATVHWCIECWAGDVAESSGLTEDEATVYGAVQFLPNVDISEASLLVGRADLGGKELHRRAHDKVTGRRDASEMDDVGPLSISTGGKPFRGGGF